MTDYQSSLKSLKIRMIIYAVAIIVINFLVFWFMIWPVLSYDRYRWLPFSQPWLRERALYEQLSQILYVPVLVIAVIALLGIWGIIKLFKKYTDLQKEFAGLRKQAAG